MRISIINARLKWIKLYFQRSQSQSNFLASFSALSATRNFSMISSMAPSMIASVIECKVDAMIVRPVCEWIIMSWDLFRAITTTHDRFPCSRYTFVMLINLRFLYFGYQATHGDLLFFMLRSAFP